MAGKKPNNNNLGLDTLDSFFEDFERLHEASNRVTHAVEDTAKEFTTAMAKGGEQTFQELMKQMWGSAYGDNRSKSENSHAQEDTKKHEKTEKRPHIEAGIDYAGEIIHAEKRVRSQETRELQQKIQEIMAELKKLAATSKELQSQFREVAVEQAPVNPGKYHENFMEWMLITIRTIRQRVEDSGQWLQAMSSKKDKKGYWSMFKKHGTMFGMSGERSVSNQVA